MTVLFDKHPDREIQKVLDGKSEGVIVQGDCLEIMADMPDGCIDMIFTDPPYGHKNNDDGDLISRWEVVLGVGDGSEPRRPIANDGPEANDFFKASLSVWRRLMYPGCCCCCCAGGGGPNPQFARWSLWLDEVFNFKQMVDGTKGLSVWDGIIDEVMRRYLSAKFPARLVNGIPTGKTSKTFSANQTATGRKLSRRKTNTQPRSL